MNFFNMGPGEMILILVVALIVFGPGKLPEMGRSLGRGIAEFRRATGELSKELTGAMDAANEVSAEPAPAAANTKPCPRCSTANPSDNLYCSECGAWLAGDDPALAGATAVACWQCNALNPAGNKFCRACGNRLRTEQVETAVAATTSYPLAVPDVPQLPMAEAAEARVVEGEATSAEAQPSEEAAVSADARAAEPTAAEAPLDLPEIDHVATAEPERTNGAVAAEPTAAEIAALAESHAAEGDAAGIAAAVAEQEEAPSVAGASTPAGEGATTPADEAERKAEAAPVGAGGKGEPA